MLTTENFEAHSSKIPREDVSDCVLQLIKNTELVVNFEGDFSNDAEILLQNYLKVLKVNSEISQLNQSKLAVIVVDFIGVIIAYNIPLLNDLTLELIKLFLPFQNLTRLVLNNPFIMSFLLEENTFQHHLKSVSDIFLQIVQDYESVLRLASNQFFEWFRLNGMDNANPEIMQCLLSIVDFLDQNNQLNESFSTPNFHKSMVNHILNPDVIVSSCALGILYSTIKNDKLKKEIFCESNIDQLCKLILNVVHRELGSEFFQNELILLLKKFKDHDWINQQQLVSLGDQCVLICQEADSSIKFKPLIKIVNCLSYVGLQKSHPLLSLQIPLGLFDHAAKESIYILEHGKNDRVLLVEYIDFFDNHIHIINQGHEKLKMIQDSYTAILDYLLYNLAEKPASFIEQSNSLGNIILRSFSKYLKTLEKNDWLLSKYQNSISQLLSYLLTLTETELVINSSIIIILFGMIEFMDDACQMKVKRVAPMIIPMCVMHLLSNSTDVTELRDSHRLLSLNIDWMKTWNKSKGLRQRKAPDCLIDSGILQITHEFRRILDEKERQHEYTISKLEKSMESIKKEGSVLMDEKLFETIQTTRKKNQALQQSCSDLHEENRTLDACVSNLTQEKSMLQITNEGCVRRIEMLELELENSMKKMSSMVSELEQKSEIIHNLEAEIDEQGQYQEMVAKLAQSINRRKPRTGMTPIPTDLSTPRPSVNVLSQRPNLNTLSTRRNALFHETHGISKEINVEETEDGKAGAGRDWSVKSNVPDLYQSRKDLNYQPASILNYQDKV